MVLLTLMALAGPASLRRGQGRSMGYVVDVSQSLGVEGVHRVVKEVRRISEALGADVEQFAVLAGKSPELIGMDSFRTGDLEPFLRAQASIGGQTNYAAAIELAAGLIPAGTGKELMLLGDGFETVGMAKAQAKRLAANRIQMHCLGVAGLRIDDARVLSFSASRNQVSEGATVKLEAIVEATLDGVCSVKLYENGVEVDKRDLEMKSGLAREVVFERTAGKRDIYGYRVVVEGGAGLDDKLPGNNEGLTVVDVRGKMQVLYFDEDRIEGQYLPRAMEKEGIDFDWRKAAMAPKKADELVGYDAVILSEVSADQLGEAAMVAIREYVEMLGGGLLVLGGPRSFGVGGYFKSPLEDVFPVRMRSTDEEENQSAAVALILDRSGSMAGEKLEMAKGAAIATAEVLGRGDQLGVYAFDSEAKVVSPMARLTSISAVSGQISALTAGGGTHLEPAFLQAREALRRVKAKVKHMIILTDGQTSGSGYEVLAGGCRAEGMTVSTVALGEGAHVGLLQAVAVSGGGQSYRTLEPEGITRIFTQDTLMHTGRMIREEPFEATVAESHAMIEGLEPWQAPPLQGYVKTIRRASAQVPLVTDAGDPLLSHWRFGLGKVTAFTSDAKSRWAALWVSRWSDYGVFWSQVLRETARPPQAGRMDLSAEIIDGEARVLLDVRTNGEVTGNDKRVDLELFRMVAGSTPGSTLQRLGEGVRLSAVGPGLFEGRFQPGESGVYLVRARMGSETVSTGLVYQTMTEASMGKVDEQKLRELSDLTGGTLLEAGEVPSLTSLPEPYPHEWWTTIAAWLLIFGGMDLVTRRWEQVSGILDSLRLRL